MCFLTSGSSTHLQLLLTASVTAATPQQALCIKFMQVPMESEIAVGRESFQAPKDLQRSRSIDQLKSFADQVMSDCANTLQKCHGMRTKEVDGCYISMSPIMMLAFGMVRK
jgi:hypothetical protein